MKVKRVEVNEKHIPLRVILFFVFLIIAIAGIAVGVYSLSLKKEGWYQIESDNADISGDFSFNYYISGNSNNERRNTYNIVKNAYSSMCLRYKKVFDTQNEYDDVVNVAYINKHLNEDIVVDKELYYAFSKLNEHKDNRILYYRPIFDAYYNLFNYVNNGASIDQFNPDKNQQLKDYIDELFTYCNDENSISIKVLADNKIRLEVSDSYVSYCETNGISTFIDFAYLRNVIVIDLIEDEFVNNGYINGYIVSSDGYMSIFTSENINMRIRNLTDLVITDVGSISYTGRVNIVEMFPFLANQEGKWYYIFDKNSYVTAYFTKEGKSSPLHLDMLFYSDNINLGCIDILLDAYDVFVDESLDLSKVNNLKDNDISTIYSKDNKIYYNDDNSKIDNIIEGYTKEKIS